MSDKHQHFQDLHRQEGCFLMPNAWDAGSAKALAAGGFPALGTTSAGLAYAMGRRDEADIIGLEAALDNIRAIASATDLPVSADFENGYGETPEAVAEAIRRCAQAGASGASIEDLPGDPARGLYAPDVAAARVAAAVDAARSLDRPFTITARAESYLVGVTDAPTDALARLKLYAHAGADCVYAPGVRDRDEIARLVQEAGAPLNVLVGIPGMGTNVEEMRTLGVRRLSIGGSLTRAAWRTVLDGIAQMQNGQFTFTDHVASDRQITEPFD